MPKKGAIFRCPTKAKLPKFVEQVLAENVQAANVDVKNGEMKAIGFLVGQVMKQSQGKMPTQPLRNSSQRSSSGYRLENSSRLGLTNSSSRFAAIAVKNSCLAASSLCNSSVSANEASIKADCRLGCAVCAMLATVCHPSVSCWSVTSLSRLALFFLKSMCDTRQYRNSSSMRLVFGRVNTPLSPTIAVATCSLPPH